MARKTDPATEDLQRGHVRELDWIMLAVVGLCCLGLIMAVSVLGPSRHRRPDIDGLTSTARGYLTLIYPHLNLRLGLSLF